MFDHVVITDWSAANKTSPARPSKDAIWIGVASPDALVATHYFRTRHSAEVWINAFLDDQQGQRVLLGFDFPMGYPAGFARHLTGQDTATSVHAWLARHITDDPTNANNRFAVAAAINAGFGGHGPFWGRPDNLALPALSPRKTANYPTLGFAERRAVETIVPRAQPVWKLYTTGSVGSQTLMGLPVIHRLCQRPGTALWPFDTPDQVTLAEVYPSLLATPVLAAKDTIKDRAQVQLLARALLTLSQHNRIAPLFDTPAIAREEGWILGAGHAPLLEQALAWT
ncbi:MAG: hypothetical protein ACRC6I_00170 [Paracoccaceae bacterium]